MELVVKGIPVVVGEVDAVHVVDVAIAVIVDAVARDLVGVHLAIGSASPTYHGRDRGRDADNWGPNSAEDPREVDDGGPKSEGGWPKPLTGFGLEELAGSAPVDHKRWLGRTKTRRLHRSS